MFYFLQRKPAERYTGVRFYPLFFGINSCLGYYWSSVSTFSKFFFAQWGIILTLMLSALSGSARSEVCVDPDDGRPHSAPSRTAQSDIKPLIPRPPPMNVLKIGDTIGHWPPGHEIMPKKMGVKSIACVPLKVHSREIFLRYFWQDPIRLRPGACCL